MEHGRIDNGNGAELAYQRSPGRGPCIVFLPGFRSDMGGDKAQAIASCCVERQRAVLLFDYAGHGASSGYFETGTISSWLSDSLCAVDQLTSGPLVLIGSSMGGWLALLVALARPSRIAALVGIAAAPDFTETMMWEAMTFDERATLLEEGVLAQPSAYGQPYQISLQLIEDGRRNLLLGRPIAVEAPVRLLHGQADREVPWQTSLKLAEQLMSQDVRVALIKDGEHRLSRPADIALLRSVLLDLLEDGT